MAGITRRGAIVGLGSLVASFGCQERPAGTHDDAGGAPPQVVDVSRLYPLIVPVEYALEGAMRVNLVEGLMVAFAQDQGGVARYVRAVDLAASKLSLADAQRLSLENLRAAANRNDIKMSTAAGPDGKPQLMIWSGHWLAASSVLLPGVLPVAQDALGETDICAAIPHREAMVLFGVRDEPWRARMLKIVDENEGDGRKPLTRRLLRLLPTPKTTPYYEKLPFEYLS